MGDNVKYKCIWWAGGGGEGIKRNNACSLGEKKKQNYDREYL